MQDGQKVDLLGSMSPARTAAAVTPSDTANLDAVCDRLYIGDAGAVTVVFAGASPSVDGATVTYTVQSGQYLWVRAKRVNATGTTASGIVAEYK